MLPKILISGTARVDTTKGLLKVVTGTDPAAGAEISETVPAGKAWLLLAFHVTFATDATAANRIVNLAFDDGSTTFYRQATTAAVTASLTPVITWARAGSAISASGISSQNSLLVDAVIPAGYRMKTVTANLQAGDNYSAPVLYVIEYDLA